MKKLLITVVALSAFISIPAFAGCNDGGTPSCGTNCTGHVATRGQMWVDIDSAVNVWGTGEKVDIAAFSSGTYDMNANFANDDFVNISGGYMAGGSGHDEVNVGGSAKGFASWGNFRGWDAPAGW